MIESICKVFKADKNFVKAQWESMISDCTLRLISLKQLYLTLKLLSLCLVFRNCIIKAKVVDQGLINENLLISFFRWGLQKVKDLHVVFSSDFDTEAIFVRFVELLDDSLVVIIGKSSVLHDLNLGFATDVSGTSLGSVVHDGDLKVAAVLISHGDGRVDGVVVGGDVLEFLVDLEIVVVVKLSLLHG